VLLKRHKRSLQVFYPSRQILSGQKRAASVVLSVTTVRRATGVSVRSGPTPDYKTQIIQE